MKRLFAPILFIEALYVSGFNLMAVLRLSAKLQPKAQAVSDTLSEIKYSELYERAKNVLIFFYKKNKNVTGQKIGILAQNHIDLLAVLFGTSPLGANIFLLNTHISAKQLSDLDQKHHFDMLLYDEEFADLAQAITCERLAFSNIPFSNTKKKTAIRLPKKRSNFTLLTSGTTGAFKTATRRPALLNFLAPFWVLLTQLKLYRYPSVFIATPIYHGFGFASVVLSVVLGVKIQLMPHFNTKKAAFLIKKQQIAVITLVPSILHKLLYDYQNDIQSLRCIVSGGAPLASNLVKMVIHNLDCQLFSLYGTSEAGFCILATPDDLKKQPTTIGKPINGVKTLILNKENLPVKDNEIGRLCIKTHWSIIENSAKNWVETGDWAYKNAANHYFLYGRTDEMMVINGENVYPITIENTLLEHDAIAQVAVIALHDAIAGQRPKAFVVLAKNQNKTNENDLLTFLKSRLPRHQIPKSIVFVTDLPCNAIGKIDKQKLSDTHFPCLNPCQLPSLK